MRAMTEAERAGFERLRREFVDAGELNQADLERIQTHHDQYESARRKFPEFNWPVLTPVAFVESERPHLGFRAWAAWHERDFESTTDLCHQAETQFGEHFFEKHELAEPIAAGTPLGEILKRMGVLTDEQLNKALALQRQIREKAGVHLFLGILLVRKSLITVGEYYQAVALHYGLPFEGVNDHLLSGIKAAASQQPPV